MSVRQTIDLPHDLGTHAPFIESAEFTFCCGCHQNWPCETEQITSRMGAWWDTRYIEDLAALLTHPDETMIRDANGNWFELGTLVASVDVDPRIVWPYSESVPALPEESVAFPAYAYFPSTREAVMGLTS